MNAPSDQAVARPSYFRARPFLVGLALGLVLLAWLGRSTPGGGRHSEFQRYFPAISPEGSYYPTVDEMCAIVRAQCRPDQVLVLVGGNSIFNGVGQPADKLWTRTLQEKLGDRYAVVNLALRGAYSTEGGAVIAEVLRKEFPRQIYLANSGPLVVPVVSRSDTYGYLFWEAYYRGLLESHPPRTAMIYQLWHMPINWSVLFQEGGRAQMDRVLRFSDLWNRVAFERVFTAHSFFTPRWPEAVWPRRRLRDAELDFEDFPFDSPRRFGPAKTSAEMSIVRGFTLLAYERGADGSWRLKPEVRENILLSARAAIPDGLRGRTLIVLSRNSPFYLRQLAADEMARDDAAYRDGCRIWREAGCRALEYGRDFADADFGDRTHLTVSGGRKLAAVLAEEVKAMSAELGYLTGEKHE